MNPAVLKKWHELHAGTYRQLASECGSYVELALKLDVFGEKWTIYDWIFFLAYLHYGDAGYEHALLEDIIETLDKSGSLDGVFTKKDTIMFFIDMASRNIHGCRSVCFRVLAHIFRKHPEIWNMNYMWIKSRRRGTIIRRHRMSKVFRGNTIDNFINEYSDFKTENI